MTRGCLCLVCMVVFVAICVAAFIVTQQVWVLAYANVAVLFPWLFAER